ncbi:MAG: hypothetical protein JST62_06880 [Bacteroidetes bacterium]|nr:hypothetical protein [Bacteroidota bacterium]
MKNKFLQLTSITTFLLILSMFTYAFFKIKKNGFFVNIELLIVPIVSIALYLLLTFFIKNPKLLVKKSLAQIENPNLENTDTIEKWKTIFYYLRFFLILFISFLFFFGNN